MNGILEGIEKVVVEREDGKIIATITEDRIDCNPEYQVRMKPTVPKHRLFISCPINNWTEDNIRECYKKMLKIAEAYTGETLKLVNPYMPKEACGNADRIRYLADSINLMAGADYFITATNFWQYGECSVEKKVAEDYGLKIMFADLDTYYTPILPVDGVSQE